MVQDTLISCMLQRLLATSLHDSALPEPVQRNSSSALFHLNLEPAVQTWTIDYHQFYLDLCMSPLTVSEFDGIRSP